jgi:DNA polymerase-4
MGTAVLHVDLDQFIVAVELLRRPELRGRPVLVGGTGDPTRRGVVAGASYEARACGVRSGTPLRTAAARCPDAVFLPLDRPAYEAASARFLAALREVAPVAEPAGWDEAYALAGPGDPVDFARLVQARIRERTGLSCAVGIGDNKLRAKIASGLGKPGGVFRLDEGNWEQVMAGRPADALQGVGPKTVAKLAGLGVGTVGELATADLAAMAAAFGPAIGPALVATARGLDDDPVRAVPPAARSHGRELTFQQDLADPAALRWHIRRLAGQVAADLAESGELARRVVVKVRQRPFTTRTHGVGLAAATRDPALLAEAAAAAFARHEITRPVRLLGVRAEVRAEVGQGGTAALPGLDSGAAGADPDG